MPEYIDRATELGVQHIAVTDHGVMYASLEWYKQATAAGLHPIVGIEAYMSEGPVAARDRKSYHLLLLAENLEGYRNLVRLTSFGFTLDAVRREKVAVCREEQRRSLLRRTTRPKRSSTKRERFWV